MATAIHPRRRTTSLVAALALAASGLLSAPAAAADNTPSDLVEACENAPDASSKFSDYPSNSRHRQIVDCLSSGYKGDDSAEDFVLRGSNGRLSFNDSISRGQFAIILNRVADMVGIAGRTAPSQPTFADVSRSHPFYNQIEELFARGLTEGKGEDVDDVDNDGNTTELWFDPNGTVSYPQVLVFVHRLLTNPEGLNRTLPNGQRSNSANGMDCGFAASAEQDLNDAGFLIRENTPSVCKMTSPRSLVFDLIATTFDHTVEVGIIDSPHFVPPGTVTLTLDQNETFTGGSVLATVEVLDGSDKPVQGQAVEVFAVKASDAFDGQGNPKADNTLSVNGTGRYGTGTSPAQIDSQDPTTNSSGKVTVSVTTGNPSGGTFDVYAFIGETAVVWKDVKGSADATGKKTVTFTAKPADIVVSSTTSPTNTLQYGTSYVVKFQLVDSSGNPVKRSGVRIDARKERVDTCADPTNSSARCQGGTAISTAPGLTTNSEGIATLSIPGPTDPDQTNGSAGDGVNGGDRSTETISGTMPAQDGLAAISSTKSYSMEFRDAAAGTVEVATWEFLASSNPNPNKLDEVAKRQGVQVDVQVRATDFYGNPAAGVLVRLRYDTLGSGDVLIQTGGNGVAVHTIAAPGSVGDRTYTATVDADRNGSFSLAGADFNATTVTGGTELDIHWVGDPTDLATYSNQDIVGHSISGSYVDLHGAHVRVPFDGGDTYQIRNGAGGTFEAATQSDFINALNNDAGSDDTVTVQYQANNGLNGVSTWQLTIVGGSTFP